MKQYSLILLLLISLSFHSCSEEELSTAQVTPSKTSVSFFIDEITSAEIPDGSSLLLSINFASGQEVYSDYVLTLARNDGVLTSESIELGAMEFELTEFMILHDEEVIYASPKVGSDMAQNVSRPLAQKFVTRGASQLSVPVEVADARNAEAKKFGYGSFKKKAKNTFQIIAYFYDNGVKTPLSSYLQIKNEDSAFYYYMDPKVNTFTFNGDRNDTYTLTTYRPGFYRETMEFALNKLKGKNNLIEIVMGFTDPMDVIRLSVFGHEGEEVKFTLGMIGVGTLTVDYGNSGGEYGPFPANPTIVAPPDTSYMTFEAQEVREDQPITVSGDLEQVVSFENASTLASLDVTRLPNLSKLNYRNSYAGQLDLTQNTKLRYLALDYSRIDDIMLDGNVELNKVYLRNMFSGADRVISKIYENNVTHNIQGGSLTLVDQPISESSRQILSDLQSKYNWSVTVVTNE